jgi:hypothetical protein
MPERVRLSLSRPSPPNLPPHMGAIISLMVGSIMDDSVPNSASGPLLEGHAAGEAVPKGDYSPSRRHGEEGRFGHTPAAELQE